MQRILALIEEAKAQHKYGLITTGERDQIIRGLELELMGCDCL